MVQSGIYCWTSPSGKKYIGQSVDLVSRKKEFFKFSCTYAGNKIEYARKKYNQKEDWNYQVLEYCSEEMLDEREIYWIDYYDTMNNGYNSVSGGNSTKGFKFSEEQKQQLSESHKGQIPWMKGKHHSDESKKKMSDSHKGLSSPNKGKHSSDESRRKNSESHKFLWNDDEYRKKLSEAHKGISNPNKIPILCYNKDRQFIKEYISLSEASRDLDLSLTKVCAVCRGRRKSTGGYTFK